MENKGQTITLIIINQTNSSLRRQTKNPQWLTAFRQKTGNTLYVWRRKSRRAVEVSRCFPTDYAAKTSLKKQSCDNMSKEPTKVEEYTLKN